MTVFQLSGDLFIKESQLGLNNGRRKKKGGGGKSVWRQWREADRLWMSSLNITRWNKPAARICPWRGAKLLMLLDASLLEPRRSSEHGEGKQDAENGLLLRVLAWGIVLWKYFKKKNFYTIRLFGGEKKQEHIWIMTSGKPGSRSTSIQGCGAALKVRRTCQSSPQHTWTIK